MFIKVTKQGYDKHGQQFAHGYFLILMTYRNYPGLATSDGRLAMRARIVYTRMKQCGQFMMGKVKIKGYNIILSGTYGEDGLCPTVPKEVWDTGIPVPNELYDAWADGGGWNGPGREAEAMHAFGYGLLMQYRRNKHIRKNAHLYAYDYYIIDCRGLLGDYGKDGLADIAINAAREKTKLYATPCEWTATPLVKEPGLFRVRRKRNKVSKGE